MENYSILTHPLTLVLIGAFASVMTWLITTFVRDHGDLKTLAQTAVDIKELLNMVVADRKKDRADLDMLINDHERLKAEHGMMLRAGNLIGAHGKKNEPA